MRVSRVEGKVAGQLGQLGHMTLKALIILVFLHIGFWGTSGASTGQEVYMELPFERQALRNEPLPRGLSGVSVLSYYAMCYIYRLYKSREITQQQGSAAKREVKKADDEVSQEINQHAIRWQEIESAARTYSHNPTRETADAFYAAVYGVPDDWRNDRNKAAIENITWEESKNDNSD